MRFLEDLSLLGGIANIFLAVFVLSRGWGNTAHRVYFFLGLAIGIWNIGSSRMFSVASAEEAYRYARLLQFGVIFTPVLLFHLSILIADLRYRKYIGPIYGFAALLAVGNIAGWFVTGVRYTGYAWYSIPGPLFWIFCLSFSLTFLAVIVLSNKRKLLPPLHRSRLTPLIVAQLSLAILGANDLLPILGVDYYFFTTIQIVPFGGIAAVVYGMLTAYSVLQHEILDARITLGRTTAHILRAAFVTVGAGMLMFLLHLLLPERPVTTGMVAVFITAMAAAYIFPRLLGKGAESFERRLLGDRFEYHDKVRAFIPAMIRETDSEKLLDAVESVLTRDVGISDFSLLLVDEPAQRLVPARGGSNFPAPNGDAVFKLALEHGVFRLGAALSYRPPVLTPPERAALDALAEIPFEVCFPLVSGESALGLLLLGTKRRGERYTNEDLDLLESLAKNLGLILGQIRLRNQVLLSQEMDLLGRMSRGIAHDLNNLITPVSTFLQLTTQGRMDEESRLELLPVAHRNVETMRAYIREALFFSEQNKPKLESVALREIALRAAELVRPQLDRKKITLTCEGDLHLVCDELLIQRALVNIISNAADASSDQARIRITFEHTTGKSGGWGRVCVIDEGQGISPENLSKIGTPYFTTKDTGDHTRGFGLGLSICRRIVHLHGGHMAVLSELGIGTTVQLDLPGVRQDAEVGQQQP